ncbi:tRNA-splicing endonuclease subunit Sen54-like [Lethenteron reissneri]|uniref:tRNA-splicing endonuclease subunit Sen54-like n=1 Tax=Lethenteron reissneri TaxID=7753 RepID=UPI002AB75C5F|nr:tRNA-splicing endonuclease subunit Sen54-like [Lethenteron reissneri]
MDCGREKVELKSKPGKFWQTMGHMVNGRQLLYPEEALYLLECGSIELRVRGLPLSIQEGHELALATEGLSLHQYQVYAHLKRLGYVVTRFRPENVPARNEQQPSEPVSRGEKRHKRKCSGEHQSEADSKRERCSAADTDAAAAHRHSSPEEPDAGSSPAPAEEEQPAAPPCRGFGFSPALPVSGSPSAVDGRHHRRVRSCRWDFAMARFPNVAPDDCATSLRELPGHLVPPGTAGRRSDEGRWAGRINLHRERNHGWRYEEHNPHRRWDVDRDPEARRCRDWADFKQLLARRHGRREAAEWGQQPHGRPSRQDHVEPLTNPAVAARSHAELLQEISVVAPMHILEGASRLLQEEEEGSEVKDRRGTSFTISYDVFSADNTDFKKTRPGVPLARICVCCFEDPVPDLRALKLLARRGGGDTGTTSGTTSDTTSGVGSDDTVLVFGVVDAGDVSFFSFYDFKLPTDVLG